MIVADRLSVDESQIKLARWLFSTLEAVQKKNTWLRTLKGKSGLLNMSRENKSPAN